MDNYSVQNVLNQIRALQDVVHQRNPKVAETSAPGGQFAQVLRNSLEQVNQAQTRANGLAHDFESGAPGVNLQDVMISMQKANISFQTVVQVRNRVVAAYQDIMNMPV
ncbi:MAG: flagellar hook-basal body complex protein FliE [Burkholderiales bacterium]